MYITEIPAPILTLAFFLPAGISNMSPVFAAKLPWLQRLNAPLDFGKSYKGVRIFGANKTWRGLISGTIAGTLVGIFMSVVFLGGLHTYIFMSAAMSAGALVGDAVESFFKRQAGIASGKSWFPFDQTDYIIGGILALVPFSGFFTTPWWFWVIIFLEYFGLHLLSSYVGYLLGLKDQPI